MIRFSIRDVLWLTVLLAVALAWVLDRGHLVKQGGDARAQVTEYKKYGLDRDLERMKNPPHRPRWPSQAPPLDRTPWIEKLERQSIHPSPQSPER
jgi:hypothetical protein